MPDFEYKISIKVDPGGVVPKNQKTSFDAILGMFEKHIKLFKLSTAGMRLTVDKIDREGAGSGDASTEESWKEFRESLRRG